MLSRVIIYTYRAICIIIATATNTCCLHALTLFSIYMQHTVLHVSSLILTRHQTTQQRHAGRFSGETAGTCGQLLEPCDEQAAMHYIRETFTNIYV
jgi:hypothetical protein